MSVLVWVLMGLAIWHFTVWIPDRFWGGIVGAFFGALIGSVLIGLIVNGFSVPSRDDTDLAVARAIVELCQVLGRYCVAEGVETAEQFHLLADLGVDAFQGWLFGHPAPPAEFAELVARGVVDVPARPSSPAAGS